MSHRIASIGVITATLLSCVAAASAQQARPPVPLYAQPGAEMHTVLLAQAGTSPVDLDVVSACVNDVATFKIVNKGSSWPEMGTLNVYRVTDGGTKPISTRKMRFTTGQKASFRMKKVGNATIALFVQPSWYERPFKFDAQVICK